MMLRPFSLCALAGHVMLIQACGATSAKASSSSFDELKTELRKYTSNLPGVGDQAPEFSGRTLKNWRLWWARPGDLLGLPFVDEDGQLDDYLDPDFQGLSSLRLPIK